MSVKGLVDLKSFSFIWKINDFSKLCENQEDTWIISPVFEVAHGVNKSLWKIKLMLPKGESRCTQMFLQYLDESKHVITADDTYSFKLALLNASGSKTQIKVSDILAFDKVKQCGSLEYIRKSFIMDRNGSFLVNDTLSIYCRVNINYMYSKYEIVSQFLFNNSCGTFCFNEKFSDITIIVDQEQIKAHKIVLATKSKVFAAMLEHDMKESNSHTIEIHDISLDVIRELLSFMYSGKVQNLKKIAQPLLAAADKYDVGLLKVVCEKSMKENLTVENACESLIASDLYNCQQLKHDTIDFIISNLISIVETHDFEQLKDTNPKVLEEILRRMAEQKKLEDV